MKANAMIRTICRPPRKLAVATSLIAGLLILAGCAQTTHDVGYAGRNPGILVCGGQGSIGIDGQAMIYGASGHVMFNCGAGAYFGQGYPAANLPVVPGAPALMSMPPLGPPPVSTAP